MGLFDTPVKAEYYYKRVRPMVYTVVKFLGTVAPIAIYTVTLTRNGMQCNCLAGTRHLQCKHKEGVKRWISCGRPLPRAFDFYDGRAYGKQEMSPYSRTGKEEIEHPLAGL